MNALVKLSVTYSKNDVLHKWSWKNLDLMFKGEL